MCLNMTLYSHYYAKSDISDELLTLRDEDLRVNFSDVLLLILLICVTDAIALDVAAQRTYQRYQADHRHVIQHYHLGRNLNQDQAIPL